MLRLPPGWSAGPPHGGYAVAAPTLRQPGDPIVFHRAVPAEDASLHASARALVSELDSTYADLLLSTPSPCGLGAVPPRCGC